LRYCLQLYLRKMANYYLVLKEGKRIVDCVATEEEKFEVHEDFLWVEGPSMDDGMTTAEYQCSDDLQISLRPAPDYDYALERKFRYPSYADQFDLLYHGGYDAWKEKITKVKQQYPKPK